MPVEWSVQKDITCEIGNGEELSPLMFNANVDACDSHDA